MATIPVPGVDYFGWDLLYSTVAASISDESDIVIALLHWFLTKNASFRCVGVGDDKTIGPEDVGSELLPNGWNGGTDKYALRYRHQDDVFILLGTKTDDTLVINLLDAKSRNVSNLSVGPKDIVKNKTGPLQTMIPTVSTILDRIQHELLEPVFNGRRKDVDTQTEAERARARSRSPPEPRLTVDPLMVYPSNRRDPLRDVGRGDLDPLGRGGGGMIFPPPNLPFPGQPGGFNPLRQPPGSRFDPFGPPERNFGRNPNPNPDLFRPPPDYDDMFM